MQKSRLRYYLMKPRKTVPSRRTSPNNDWMQRRRDALAELIRLSTNNDAEAEVEKLKEEDDED